MLNVSERPEGLLYSIGKDVISPNSFVTKIIRRRLPPRTQVVNTRPRPARTARTSASASGTASFRVPVSTSQSDRLVTKELIEKKQLEHDVQLLKIELSQVSTDSSFAFPFTVHLLQ